MSSFKSAAPAFWCAGVLLISSGCGFTGSPADGLTFQAPPGWNSSPGILGFMQFWRPPSDDREVLMLFRSPKPLSPSDVFSTQQLKQDLQSVTIERRETIKICNNQPASYVAGIGKSRRGEENVEMLMTTTRATTYMALYVRPTQRPPNPAAEAAVRELCAKP